jgi:hypothetical protein
MLDLWVIMPCGLHEYIPTFWKNILPPSLAQRWMQYVPPKHWYLPTNPHGITTHKTNTDIFTAMRTSNLIKYSMDYSSFQPNSTVIITNVADTSIKNLSILKECEQAIIQCKKINAPI